MINKDRDRREEVSSSRNISGHHSIHLTPTQARSRVTPGHINRNLIQALAKVEQVMMTKMTIRSLNTLGPNTLILILNKASHSTHNLLGLEHLKDSLIMAKKLALRIQITLLLLRI